MMKLPKYIFATLLLVPMSLAAKNFTPKSYLPEAPYDGFEGKIDSIITSSYVANGGLQSALVANKETTVFDKNGYKTLTKTEALNADGEFVLYKMESINRNKKSLPTGRISQDQNTRTVYKLEKRENNEETYKVMIYRGFNDAWKDTTTHNKFQTIQYTDTSTITTLHNNKKSSVETRHYNNKGKLSGIYLHNGNLKSSLQCNDQGFVYQIDIVGEKMKGSSGPVTIFFKNHETTKHPTYTLITWQQTDDEDKIITFVEQKIYYRK